MRVSARLGAFSVNVAGAFEKGEADGKMVGGVFLSEGDNEEGRDIV